jgi:hypothetical protein
LIRNTTNLDDGHFTNLINQFLQNVPTESRIALYLVGMFFGALKFKALYYKFVPLPTSRLKYQQPTSTSKIESKPPLAYEQIEIGKVEEPANEQYVIPLEESTASGSHPIDTVFDEMFWDILDNRMSKLTKAQQKIIKSCYFAVVNFKGELFTSRNEYMINMLKKKLKDSKAEKPVLTTGIIAEVQAILNEYFPYKQK